MYYNQIIQNIESSKSIDDLFLNFNIDINNYMDCGLEHRKQIFSKLFRRFSQQKMIDSFLLYPSLFFIFFENKKDIIFYYHISNDYLKTLIKSFKKNQELLIYFNLHKNLTFKILCFANESDSSLAQLIIRYIKKEYVSMDEIANLSSFYNITNDFNIVFFEHFEPMTIRNFLIYKGFHLPEVNNYILEQIKKINIHLYYSEYKREIVDCFIDNFINYFSVNYSDSNSEIEQHLELILSITDYNDFYFNIEGFKDPKIAQKIIDYKKLKDNLAHF